MTKGKSKCRQARNDILRRDAVNARRRARRQPAGKRYDRQAYDKPQDEES